MSSRTLSQQIHDLGPHALVLVHSGVVSENLDVAHQSPGSKTPSSFNSARGKTLATRGWKEHLPERHDEANQQLIMRHIDPRRQQASRCGSMKYCLQNSVTNLQCPKCLPNLTRSVSTSCNFGPPSFASDPIPRVQPSTKIKNLSQLAPNDQVARNCQRTPHSRCCALTWDSQSNPSLGGPQWQRSGERLEFQTLHNLQVSCTPH